MAKQVTRVSVLFETKKLSFIKSNKQHNDRIIFFRHEYNQNDV